MRQVLALSLWLIAATGSVGYAQQAWITTPFVTSSDSFYENFGINWGYDLGGDPRRGGAFFNMGNNSTPPPFGGYDPGADATFGFRAGPFSFRLRAGQGSNRSIVSQAPSIMLPNGGTGFFASQTVRPFVTGIEPVVNGVRFGRIAPRRSILAERWKRYQYLKKHEPWKLEDPPQEKKENPQHREKLDPQIGTEDAPLVLSSSSATRPSRQPSLSPKKPAQTQPAKSKPSPDELLRLLDRARKLRAKGQNFYARLYYERAEQHAQTPALKSLIRARIRELR